MARARKCECEDVRPYTTREMREHRFVDRSIPVEDSAESSFLSVCTHCDVIAKIDAYRDPFFSRAIDAESTH
jgi:hypothetical protein